MARLFYVARGSTVAARGPRRKRLHRQGQLHYEADICQSVVLVVVVVGVIVFVIDAGRSSRVYGWRRAAAVARVAAGGERRVRRVRPSVCIVVVHVVPVRVVLFVVGSGGICSRSNVHGRRPAEPGVGARRSTVAARWPRKRGPPRRGQLHCEADIYQSVVLVVVGVIVFVIVAGRRGSRGHVRKGSTSR